MLVRVLAVVVVAGGVGLAACGASYGDGAAASGRPVASAEVDTCGSVAAEFGQVGGAFGLGGANDDAPWQTPLVSGLPDQGLTAFLDRLKAENAAIDRIQAAYDRVTECRRTEVHGIKADVAASRLSRAAAEARLAAIHRLYQTDVLVARLVGQVVTLRAERFHEAARRPVVAAHPSRRLREEIAEQTASNQAKRGAFVASVARAETWRDTGFVLGGTVP